MYVYSPTVAENNTEKKQTDRHRDRQAHRQTNRPWTSMLVYRGPRTDRHYETDVQRTKDGLITEKQHAAALAEAYKATEARKISRTTSMMVTDLKRCES